MMPEFRTKKGVEQILAKILWDPDGQKIDAAIAELKGASAGLEEAYIEVDLVHEYDTSYVHIYICGWRVPTTEELQHRAHQGRLAAEQQREFEDRQIALLKRTRPELFK